MSKKGYILYIAAAIVMIAGIILGSMFDLNIAGFMYSGHPLWAVIITFAELYIFDGAFVLLFGVLCGQLRGRAQKTSTKNIILVIFTYLALSTAVCGAIGLWSDSVLGLYVADGMNGFLPSLVTGLIIFFPLFPLGMAFNGKKYDKDTCRRLIILTIVLAVAFFASIIVKTCVMRPRFRITLEGYEGIGFVPVFTAFDNGKELMAKHSLGSDDLASFFSGHAMDSVLNVIIFPAFALFIDKFEGKEFHLTLAAVIFCIPVLLSRMILGDHYLSDLMFGALVGLAFCFIYSLLASRRRNSI
ncbi:MAG: phosphatase PAP2 family protein [Clostridiales bacterium]|nr:phosphatase PAP2 family protein [Clostridiales bacterium]